MADTPYFGGYFRFETTDKRAATDLLTANNLAGDAYHLEFEETDEGTRGWLVNRFDDRVGYLTGTGAYQARIQLARGWTVTAYLSFVAYSEKPEPGQYWGEVALICYDPRYDEQMQPFLAELVKRMANGVRPKIDFGEEAFEQLIESNGTWFPADRVKKPHMEKGTAVVKDHRTPNDRLVEESRKGKPGCYVASWVFLLALVALIVLALHSCGVF
jgi:hypothetical protein